MKRSLTAGEIALAQVMFQQAIDYAAVSLVFDSWWQKRSKTALAPNGNVYFPRHARCEDFSLAAPHLQVWFMHEMTHVWQAQTRGRWYLVLMRHPFATYDYSLKPGWPLHRYGLEQQAEIVRHYWLLTQGRIIGGAPGIDAYRAILPFTPAA